MYEFKKVGIWSFAKFSAITGAILGLFAGLLFAILGSLIGMAGGTLLDSYFSRAWIVIIIAPLVYGFFGLIGGAVSGLLYNLVAKMVGGIRFEIVEKEESQ
ncbi:MAG: hypothetical protein ABIE36_02890 [Candidatus Diapherotrites archaeon]